MKCENCGAPFEPNKSRCSYCGTPYREHEAQYPEDFTDGSNKLTFTFRIPYTTETDQEFCKEAGKIAGREFLKFLLPFIQIRIIEDEFLGDKFVKAILNFEDVKQGKRNGGIRCLKM